MARKGHQDRGLLSKLDTTGKALWYVRLMHEGKERRFGSFPTKTKARQFYAKAKTEQHEGRFFPERSSPNYSFSRNAHQPSKIYLQLLLILNQILRCDQQKVNLMLVYQKYLS